MLKGNMLAHHKPEETQLLTIKNIPVDLPDFLFIVADLEGNILAKQQHHTGQTSLILKTNKQFEGTKINLFRISANSPTFIDLFAFASLNVNSDFYFSNNYPVRELDKPINLKFKNIPVFDKIAASTDWYANEINNINDTTFFYKIPYNRTINSDLLMLIEKQNSTYYRMFDINADENNNVLVDLSKVNIKAAKHQVQLPAGAGNVYATIEGKSITGNAWYRYGRVFSPNQHLELPVTNSCFKSYACAINFDMPVDPNINAHWRYGMYSLKLPNKFEPLNIQINSLKYDEKSFQVNYTGESDGYFAFFMNIKNISGSFPYCYLQSDTNVDVFNWPNFATELDRPELKMNEFFLVNLGFIKYNSESYRPYYLSANPIESKGWRTATFAPEWPINTAFGAAGKLKHKINEAANTYSNRPDLNTPQSSFLDGSQ